MPSGNCAGNVRWVLNSNYEELIIFGSEQINEFSQNTVPWKDYKSSIHSITLEKGVYGIGKFAFYGCSELNSITIPKNINNIGKAAFCNCKSLENIVVSSSNSKYESINGILFNKGGKTLIKCSSGKSITSYEISNSVTSIGSYAFHCCSNLQSIEIPDSVTSIGDYSFQSCSGLQSINIPESVNSIGDYAFQSCSRNSNITIIITIIGNYN